MSRPGITFDGLGDRGPVQLSKIPCNLNCFQHAFQVTGGCAADESEAMYEFFGQLTRMLTSFLVVMHTNNI